MTAEICINHVSWWLQNYVLWSMKSIFLEFEQPIADLEAKIEELHSVQDGSDVDIST